MSRSREFRPQPRRLRPFRSGVSSSSRCIFFGCLQIHAPNKIHSQHAMDSIHSCGIRRGRRYINDGLVLRGRLDPQRFTYPEIWRVGPEARAILVSSVLPFVTCAAFMTLTFWLGVHALSSLLKMAVLAWFIGSERSIRLVEPPLRLR